MKNFAVLIQKHLAVDPKSKINKISFFSRFTDVKRWKLVTIGPAQGLVRVAQEARKHPAEKSRVEYLKEWNKEEHSQGGP